MNVSPSAGLYTGTSAFSSTDLIYFLDLAATTPKKLASVDKHACVSVRKLYNYVARESQLIFSFATSTPGIC